MVSDCKSVRDNNDRNILPVPVLVLLLRQSRSGYFLFADVLSKIVLMCLNVHCRIAETSQIVHTILNYEDKLELSKNNNLL